MEIRIHELLDCISYVGTRKRLPIGEQEPIAKLEIDAAVGLRHFPAGGQVWFQLLGKPIQPNQDSTSQIAKDLRTLLCVSRSAM